MELAREAGIKAYEEKVNENKNTAVQMKEISKEKLQERELKLQEEKENKKKLIEGVIETKDNAAKEKEKLLNKNKDIHDKNKNEILEMLEKKKEEDLVEMRKKEELIRQIREFEHQPKEKPPNYDPTETCGIGLLEEMSMIELREKLAQVKLEREKEKEKKKLENSKNRDEKLNDLQDKVKAIKENREKKALENKEKRLEKMRKEEEQRKREELIKEQSLLEVHSKISSKKHKKKVEEDRLAKELREIRLKRQYLNANQQMVEAQAWKSLQDGAEREIKVRQNDKLIDNEKLQSIKYKERTLLADNSKKLIEDKVKINF